MKLINIVLVGVLAITPAAMFAQTDAAELATALTVTSPVVVEQADTAIAQPDTQPGAAELIAALTITSPQVVEQINTAAVAPQKAAQPTQGSTDRGDSLIQAR